MATHLVTLNRNGHTVSAFAGNEQAVKYARTNAAGDYPAGSVICVITCSQQEDARWFGGTIPRKLLSVEFVDLRRAEIAERPHGATSYSASSGGALKSTLALPKPSRVWNELNR